MIKFDFSTYMDKEKEIDIDKKKKIIDQLHNDSMNGFLSYIPDILKIKTVSSKVRDNSDVLVVIGIGGSFLGSYALKNIFFSSFSKFATEVIYVGTNLSSKYLNEVINYIKDKDVTLNVISKSGSTIEIQLAYQILKKELSLKYSAEEMKERIIITTDSEEGKLRKEAIEEGYVSFPIPSNIGGRYSILTAAHLFPLSVLGLDIEKFLLGYKKGLELVDDAYYYASLRIDLFKQKKYVENFSVYEPSLYYYTEWLKQLFGESEGKNGVGILPISTVNTRDLHSLGQFIQEGNSILFETVIKVLESDSLKTIDGVEFNYLNNLMIDSVCKAHSLMNTPSIVISIDKITIENIGMLSSFFMLAAAFSAYLFDVNPFNQPGVESYKAEFKKMI